MASQHEKPPAKIQRKAILLLTLATLFWGLSFIIMKAMGLVQQRVVPEMSLWLLSCLSVFLRFGISGVLMLLFVWKNLRQLNRRELLQGSALGLFGGVGLLFQMDGVSQPGMEASTAAFLTQAYCVIIPVVTALHQRRFPSLTVVVCSLLVLAGIGILSNVKLAALSLGKGETEVLLASILFTGQILLLEHKAFKDCNADRVTLVMCFSTALIIGVMMLFQNLSWAQAVKAHGNYQLILFLLILSVVCTLIPYALMNRWQAKISATQAGLIYCTEPLFTSLFALFLPGLIASWTRIAFINETVDGTLLLGGGLITAANLLMIWRVTTREAEPSSASEGESKQGN